LVLEQILHMKVVERPHDRTTGNRRDHLNPTQQPQLGNLREHANVEERGPVAATRKRKTKLWLDSCHIDHPQRNTETAHKTLHRQLIFPSLAAVVSPARRGAGTRSRSRLGQEHVPVETAVSRGNRDCFDRHAYTPSDDHREVGQLSSWSPAAGSSPELTSWVCIRRPGPPGHLPG